MVDAFADPDDLALLLNRSFTDDETAWIQALLEAASTYLREDVIGMQVYPQTQATFAAWPTSDGSITLPQHPIISVDQVTNSAGAVAFRWEDDRVVLPGVSERVNVTFTYGYARPPAGLARWACVLVSQTLTPLEQGLGLTVGGLSSVQIDDFRMAYANAGEGTGMVLSERNVNSLRQQYNPDNVTVAGTR